MKYEGTVYRPPSEAYSLIIQVTIGCAHNKCSFCGMYKDKKFRIRTNDEIFRDLEEARKYHSLVKRIFLADGDALVLPTNTLKNILIKIKELYPECERVGVYGAPKDILNKSVHELKELKELGLGILYLGIESGSDNILKNINKGVNSQEMIEAGKKVKESGIKLSATLISGIGSKDGMLEHARESARVINHIDPDYVGLLTLMVERGTEIYNLVSSGSFELLSPEEVMLETKEFIKELKVSNCVFRSNHASNYMSLGGVLPEDKERLLLQLEKAINGQCSFKNERFRGL